MGTRPEADLGKPDDHCEVSDDGKHTPDWHTVTAEYDGEELYVDVNCKDCGRSGCVGTHKTLEKSINW